MPQKIIPEVATDMVVKMRKQTVFITSSAYLIIQNYYMNILFNNLNRDHFKLR